MKRLIFKKERKQYLVNVQKWRSEVALFACIVTLLFSFVALTRTFVYNAQLGYPVSYSYRYFTNISNTQTALASSFIIPFAIHGIRKKRFVLPKWLSMFHYSGVICTTMVFVFAVVFILPYDRHFAIEGSNFFLHIICPLAVLISFQFVETKHDYNKKEVFICLLPFIAYSLIYLVMVVFIGEERGGWADIYMLNTFLPAYITFPMSWFMVAVIAFAIKKLSSVIYKWRHGRMLLAWEGEADPVEVKIEMYGLGRYYGLIGDKNDLAVPFDILYDVSKKYNIELEELFDAYSKGLFNGIKESQNL